MLEASKGKSPGQQQGGKTDESIHGAGKKRKPTPEPQQPAKKSKVDVQPSKASSKHAAGVKGKGSSKEESNFMKLIREQGLDKVGAASGGGKGKSAHELALEEDLREIEELKAKLGGAWRDELADDGWLDLFDSLDSEFPPPRAFFACVMYVQRRVLADGVCRLILYMFSFR